MAATVEEVNAEEHVCGDNCGTDCQHDHNDGGAHGDDHTHDDNHAQEAGEEHVCDGDCGPECQQNHDHNHDDDHGHHHEHTHEYIDEIGGFPGGGGTSDVSDYTALLYYTQNDNLRWNSGADVGTQTVITYSFLDTEDLPTVAEYNHYNARGYWSYNQTQRDQMRSVMDKYEAASGVKFVEVQGEGMINIMGADVSSVGGWANVAQSSNGEAVTGYFVNAYQSQGEGSYGYQVNLHELGHAMGLQHPHEGNVQLSDAADTQSNTVMTYNIQSPYATELGTFDVEAMQDIYGEAEAFTGWEVTVDAEDVVTIKTTFADQADMVTATNADTKIKTFNGDDTLLGRQGNDTLNAGDGNDTMTGSDGRDFMLGGAGDDVMYGDLNATEYSGVADDSDRMMGNMGNDIMYGGRSVDYMHGGGNDDVIHGGYGDDRLRGGDGNDTIYSGDGKDRITGGEGNDVFVFEAVDQNELNRVTDFTSGEDIIDLSAFGFTSLSQFSLTQIREHTLLEYGDWLDIGFLNVTAAELSDSDFAF